MNRRVVRNIGIFLSIFVILFGATSLFVYLGGYTDKVLGFFSKKEPASTTAETINQLQTDVVQPVTVEPTMPTGSVEAVWLSEGGDITIGGIQSAMKNIVGWGFNAVIADGSTEFVKAVVAEANQLGLYSFRHAKASALFNTDATALSVNAEKCAEVLSSGAQSLMLTQDLSISSEGNSLRLAFTSLRDKLLEFKPDLWLGIRTQREDKKEYTEFAGLEFFDYEYVDLFLTTRSKNANLVEFVTDKASSAKSVIFGHRNDMLLSGGLWSKPDEILLQISLLDTLEHSGNGFFSYKSLLANQKGTTDALIEFLSNHVMTDFFRELTFTRPEKKTFSTENSTVAFAGSCDKKYEVILNGEAIYVNDDGYFSFDKKLSPGKNSLAFEHKGKRITYNITYTVKVLKSVTPTGSISAQGGSSLEISAVARNSATVTAKVGNTTVKLYPSEFSDDDASLNLGSDYSCYIGTYNMPAAKTLSQKLGNFTVTASYNGLSETMTGASVTVNRKKTVITEAPTEAPSTVPQTDEYGSTITVPQVTDEYGSIVSTAPSTQEPTTQKPVSRKQYTPYQNNGVSGKSQMIEVLASYAEALPASRSDDVSVPHSTPLLKGTFDYVENESSYGTKKYYVLSSGKRVYQSDVRFIVSGFNMPSNDIKLSGISSKSKSTDILLSLAWKVPFNMRLAPQNYVSKSPGRPFSVNSLTATYIDIVFNYTTAATGKITMPSGSVIKSAEWITSASAQTVTLRLHFRKAGSFYGIKTTYDSDGTLRLSLKERSSTSLSGKVIMLDPGHGGKDSGALGVIYSGSTRLYESNVNLAIAMKVKSKLESQGATVIMTRSSRSVFLELDERRNLCRANNPDVFIAVHCDASENSSTASGTSAYYYKDYSQPLAASIHSSLVSTYKNSIYKNNPTMASKASRVMMFGPYRVTRLEECPSVLIEYGFMTNVTEVTKLADSSVQELLADATVSGISNYFKNS